MDSRVTPMDIERQVFRRRLHGWDPQEVQLYLRSVAEEIERLNLENGQLREDLGRSRQEIESFHARERMLQDTLVAAQQMGAELKEKGRQEVDLLIREARLRAEGIVQQARDELAQLDGEIGRSRAEREAIEAQLRGVIEQHLAILDLRRQARSKADNLRVLPKVGSEVG